MKQREREDNRVDVECDQCGEAMLRYPSHIREQTFCSLSCRSSWMEEAPPELSPRWMGGYTKEYGPEWEEARQLALERYNRTCAYKGCEKTRCDSGLGLHVHHIVPVREHE